MKIRTKILILAVSILFFACQNMNQKNKPLMTDKCGEYVLMEKYYYDSAVFFNTDCYCQLKMRRMYFEEENASPPYNELSCHDTIEYKDSIVLLFFINKDSLRYLSNKETHYKSEYYKTKIDGNSN